MKDQAGFFDRMARTAVHARLRGVRSGELIFEDSTSTERFGVPGADLTATVTVLDPRFYGALAFGGSVGAAEAWMDGWWRCDDLTTVVRIMAPQPEVWKGLDKGTGLAVRAARKLRHLLASNTRSGAKRNIASHYDLGNEFFELFLDPTMTYSCGIFERPDASMEEASLAKYDRACRKLRLEPAHHVVEIGSGWGGFAMHAATHYGCRVTTTTISREQFAYVTDRIRKAGLEDRVTVVLQDYRDLEGEFDRLVSIEMIEAVGLEHLGDYFAACGRLLHPDGRMFLQAILNREQDLEASRRNVDFIKRYIFPGGQLVSVGAISQALIEGSDLHITHVEDITPHYAETLRRWRTKMFENIDRMRELDVSPEFIAMWEYYLRYCEGAFQERQIGVAQILLEKPRCRTEPVLGAIG